MDTSPSLPPPLPFPLQFEILFCIAEQENKPLLDLIEALKVQYPLVETRIFQGQ